MESSSPNFMAQRLGQRAANDPVRRSRYAWSRASSEEQRPATLCIVVAVALVFDFNAYWLCRKISLHGPRHGVFSVKSHQCSQRRRIAGAKSSGSIRRSVKKGFHPLNARGKDAGATRTADHEVGCANRTPGADEDNDTNNVNSKQEMFDIYQSDWPVCNIRCWCVMGRQRNRRWLASHHGLGGLLCALPCRPMGP